VSACPERSRRAQPNGDEAAQKRAFIESPGPERVAAVGNGANLIMPDIGAALDLLLHPQRLIATLRH
jgi:hypothetical protein